MGYGDKNNPVEDSDITEPEPGGKQGDPYDAIEDGRTHDRPDDDDGKGTN